MNDEQLNSISDSLQGRISRDRLYRALRVMIGVARDKGVGQPVLVKWLSERPDETVESLAEMVTDRLIARREANRSKDTNVGGKTQATGETTDTH